MGLVKRNPDQGGSCDADCVDQNPPEELCTIIEAKYERFLRLCQRILFIKIRWRIIIYICALLLSIVFDFYPLPQSYFSRKDNFLNVYFAKFALAWTLLFLLPFVMLVSVVCCCENKRSIFRNLTRLFVAVCCWYGWTNFFAKLRTVVGHCITKEVGNYDVNLCSERGYQWKGFDISGHAFLLIYCNLLIQEEVKPMICWDFIQDCLCCEDADSTLRYLSTEDRYHILNIYNRFDPYVKMLFVALTLLICLWDFMLTCTMLFFHTMMEKLAGGLIAIFTWEITYRVWYQLPFSPGSPCEEGFEGFSIKST